MFRQLPRVLSFAVAVATSIAQPAPSPSPTPLSLVANEAITLVTKTPLGDASVQIAPGTALTNFEVQGDKVKIWQGPFGATVELAELQPTDAQSAVTTEPAATSPPNSSPTPTAPEPSPANTPEESKSSATTPSPEEITSATALPSWILPAICGALAAYGVSATLALLRSRRKSAPVPPAKVAATAPVVSLPSKATAKPAVVADEGRSIACPICGKSIPLEKVVKGRNHCPSCEGKFVGE